MAYCVAVRNSRQRKVVKELRRRLAANLRDLRQRQSMTQEELAERTGLASRHIQKLEAGEVNATLKTVALIAEGLGIEPDELLGRAR